MKNGSYFFISIYSYISFYNSIISIHSYIGMTKNKHLHCRNCNEILKEKCKYCPFCGQDTSDKIVSIKALFKDFLGDYFGFDSKIFKSIVPLMFKPGFLTVEYICGKRVKYIPPLRMYIIVSIIFFLLLSVDKPGSHIPRKDIGPSMAQRTDLTNNGSIENKEEFWDSFKDKFFKTYLPNLFFLLMPGFALILKALYFRHKKLYIEHCIFALHLHTFVFLLFSIYLIISAFFLFNIVINEILITILLLALIVYLILALKKVYQRPYINTIIKFLLLVSSYITLIVFIVLIIVILFYSQF